MENTKEITLLTGVPAVVRELTGLQQRLMTQNNGKSATEKMNMMAASIFQQVGDVMNPSEEFVAQMLSEDKKKGIWEARQFSVGVDDGTDDSKKFSFHWEFTSLKKATKGQKLKHPIDVDLTYMTERVYHVRNSEGEYVPMQAKTYDEVLKTLEIYLPKPLPRSKKLIKWTRLAGKGEEKLAGIKEEQASSHSKLEARFVSEMRDSGSGNLTPMLFDLDRASIIDLDVIRVDIDEQEGFIDTVITFDHPEADLVAANKKVVRTDLLQQLAFFFPSERV